MCFFSTIYIGQVMKKNVNKAI